jgi:nucleotide-binding universal stress UspA family protein
MNAIRTILHPTDFSERSDVAFRLACSLARDYGARLIVLHVAEPPMPGAGEGPLMVPRVVELEPLRERLRQYRPPEAPDLHVEDRLVEGFAATEILSVANEIKCDLIVMGTHGRTGVGRMLMGSVAEQIVRKASCPVMTVKTPAGSAWCSKASATATVGERAEAKK